MTSEDAHYWFPAKRHGWGWGFPRTWEGWTVILSYCAVVVIAAVAVQATAWRILIVLGATAGVLLICLKKGEPTTWRWGDE